MKQQTANDLIITYKNLHRHTAGGWDKQFITKINSLVSENEQYTCKKCGAGWSDDTDTEIALREMNRYLKFCGLSEADKIIVSLYFHWLDKESE